MFQFDQVTKSYGGPTSAVQNLSCTIPSNQTTVLVGPSGCGKTTTLRMINRMIEPTSGQISWDDRPLTGFEATKLRRQMGYVIQSGGLFPHRTVLDNVMTVPRLVGWTRARARTRAFETLDQVGLDASLARRYPDELSGGQQQRVGVARALAADPLVLLLDEPFSAVDPVVRADLQQLLLQLQRELRKTIIMITHDIDEAMTLGDQVAVMATGGRLAQFGPPQDLLERPADDFVEAFVGRDRGFRALTFQSATGLTPVGVPTTTSTTEPFAEPVLMVDDEHRPQGWRLPRVAESFRLGSTFNPEDDSLRTALDSALASPVSKAVAVDGSGRLRGVVDLADLVSLLQRDAS